MKTTEQAGENREAMAVSPARNNLQRLVLLRYVLVGVTVLALTVAWLWKVPMAGTTPVVWVVGLVVALNVATQIRLRFDAPVGYLELFAQLVADVVLWSVVMDWSDAPHSPLGSLYLLPVVIAAVTLPRRLAWCITILTIASYSYLYSGYSHTGLEEEPFGEHFDPHVLSMWATFVFGALLIAFFLERMASAIRDRDRLLASKREEQLRNERIVALGSMAVGAAHELGTPLTTMAVLVSVMEDEHASDTILRKDIRTLRKQIEECKRIISELLVSAGQARAEAARRLQLDDYLDQIVAKWQIVRPGVSCQYARHGPSPVPSIFAEQTVSQAIMSLLNNAADASPDSVQVEGEWNRDKLRVEIRDRGPGLTREAKLHAGEPFFSTKPPGQGIGIGLFLANATIERFGGKVGIFGREGGGACTLIELPLTRLLAEGPTRIEAVHAD